METLSDTQLQMIWAVDSCIHLAFLVFRLIIQ